MAKTKQGERRTDGRSAAPAVGAAKARAKAKAKAQEKAGAAEASRDPALRRRLLSRLPPLAYRESLADAVKVGSDAELRSLVELEADAFLEPLEPLAPKRGRG